MRYISTMFIYDLIPLIPMQFLKMKKDRQYLFYIVKMMRLKKGFDLYNVTAMMEKIKKYYKDSL